MDSISLDVVIPIGVNETDYPTALDCLRGFPEIQNVFLSCAGSLKADELRIYSKQLQLDNRKFKVLQSPKGTQKQINFALEKCQSSFVWILYADSHLEDSAIRKLFKELKKDPSRVYSFRLSYGRALFPLLTINTLIANLRSLVFGLSYGDQSYCASIKLVKKTLPFPEIEGDGGEILWLKRLKRHKIKIKILNARLRSSARKYVQHGWLKVTAYHFRRALSLFSDQDLLDKKPTQSSSAFCVFVKTPELSPVKTRLAKDIGELRAKNFYLRCLALCDSTLSTLSTSSDTVCYWAVAEKSALNHELWQNHPRILQNEGSLGERLLNVRKKLEHFNNVVFIGADCPTLSLEFSQKALEFLNASRYPRHVIGPAKDGGYYLFGSNYSPQKKAWLNPRYSSEFTLSDFRKHLDQNAEVLELPMLSDIDTIDDLEDLKNHLKQKKMTKLQNEFLSWMETNSKTKEKSQ
ncbi:DUF2064 domain-containing protein [bacterium]|nr:DUF2064 domain-containing protein [bacterium]